MRGAPETAGETAAAEALLREIGRAPQREFDIAAAALALALLSRRDLDPGPYRRHLESIARQVGEHGAADDDASEALRRQISALNATLVDRFGYEGDRTSYDDLDNADLARVIDRRRGLPVALGILWIHAARAQGWAISGLAFPGHFLLRLGGGATSAILDPFEAGRIHDPASLRALVKITVGADAELEPGHYAEVSDRDVLLRLENNIKLRLLRDGRLAEAAGVLDRMLLFAPDQAPLWREAGIVHARLGNLRHGADALETYLGLAPSAEEQRHAAQLLRELKDKLN